MSIKEYIMLHLVVACLTMLTIETIKVMSLQTTKNLETILTSNK